MSYISKFRGTGRPMIAVYTCHEHGEFDAEVARDESGGAPEAIECGAPLPLVVSGVQEHCEKPATWTPSPAIACRVRRVEVVRGKWEKPERKTYLDTRELGEGQDMDEFRAKRAKIWEERRLQKVKELAR